MNTSFILVVASSMALVHGYSLSAADTGFARGYRAPAEVPAWGQSFRLDPTASGYLMTAWGPAPTGDAGQSSISFVRLDEGGAIQWALWSMEGTMGYTTVTAHPTAPLVFAKIEGLAEEEFWTVFGVFTADGTRVFERGVRVTVDGKPGTYFPDPSPTVEYFSDGRCAVILDEDGEIVRVAVLDPTGKTQWQRSFASLVTPSFAIAGRGRHSNLIEDPGRGFWLIVMGSEKITTQPNPPPINSAVTINIVRLTSEGEVVWARKISGLKLDFIAPQIGPVAIGADASLIFTFTDLIIGSAFYPAPGDFHSYVIAINPDGQLRWANHVRGIGGYGLTPVLAPDGSALFLGGAKLLSTSPSLSDDGLLMKWNAATGDSLAQVSVNLGTLEDLAIAGVSKAGVFVHSYSYSLNGNPGTAYVGTFDLNLRNASWKELTRNKADEAALLYNANTGSLLFADRPTADSRVDAIALGPDLNPLLNGMIGPGTNASCAFFTDTAVASSNPNITVEKLALTQTALVVSVSDTSIVLPATARIQFRAITPTPDDLCPGARPAVVRLSSGADATQFRLSFASRVDTTYEILFTPALEEPFRAIAQITGDGQVIEVPFQLRSGRQGFYMVRALPR